MRDFFLLLFFSFLGGWGWEGVGEACGEEEHLNCKCCVSFTLRDPSFSINALIWKGGLNSWVIL